MFQLDATVKTEFNKEEKDDDGRTAKLVHYIVRQERKKNNL